VCSQTRSYRQLGASNKKGRRCVRAYRSRVWPVQDQVAAREQHLARGGAGRRKHADDVIRTCACVDRQVRWCVKCAPPIRFRKRRTVNLTRMRAEAHLTLVHGHELLHACSAAVIGETLRQADPTRARIAFVWNVSKEAHTLISHGWQVQDQAAAIKGSPLIGTTAGRKAVILDATLAGHSRPLSRAMFWDVDHMVLPTSRRIRDLWSFRTDAELVGYPESRGCFNSGFMLFRPSKQRRYEYETLLQQTAGEARGEYKRGDSRCTVTARCWRNPCESNDQSYLNAVFAGVYRPVTGKAFHMRTSTTHGRQYNSRNCLTTAFQLLQTDDAFHFFSRLSPWRGDCARCALRGKRCSYSSLPSFNAALGTNEGGAVHTCGRAAAQAVWFSTLRERVPEHLRSLCLTKLEEATAAANASCLEANQKLTWPGGGRGPAG
jgi:hypothetical protein